MMTYEVTRVNDHADFFKNIDTLPRAYVTHYPWGCTNRPETYGVLGWDEDNLHVYMRCYDQDVRAEATCDNGDIYMDSCMEFFLNPIPGVRDMFINLEVNPLGYLYLAIGPENPDKRTLLSAERYNHFDIEIREKPREGAYWDWSARVPFAFLESVVPEFQKSDRMHFTGNFFKCGDGTKSPHFGCWSNITPATEQPFFYRVDCFGAIDFVNK